MGALIADDLLFPAETGARAIARDLYASVRDLPIISPHGHTDPRWFSENEAFPNPSALLLAPDHYLFRMLHSQGVYLDVLGVPRRDGAPDTDPRAAWRVFASHWATGVGSPSGLLTCTWCAMDVRLVLGTGPGNC
jgi:glucuronate isomerase